MALVQLVHDARLCGWQAPLVLTKEIGMAHGVEIE